MKAVLSSTRPKWCEKICHEIGTDKNGKPIYEKTIEVRKTKPSIPTPFKVYIYCTNQKINGEILLTYDKKVEGRNRGFRENGDIPLAGKVIGEFICDEVKEITCLSFVAKGYEIDTCLTYKEFYHYGKGKPLYGWHISELKIYDKPKVLSEFYIRCRISDKRCRLCDNCFEREDSYGMYYAVKKLTRPPMSWCYVQE